MSKNYYNCIDGIYYTNNVYRDRPLKYIPYGSCGILETKDNIYLKSYTTMVLRLEKKTGWIWCSGLYSRTTIKHISAFLKEFCPGVSYYAIKDSYLNGMKYNINTGECKKANNLNVSKMFNCDFNY